MALLKKRDDQKFSKLKFPNRYIYGAFSDKSDFTCNHTPSDFYEILHTGSFFAENPKNDICFSKFPLREGLCTPQILAFLGYPHFLTIHNSGPNYPRAMGLIPLDR